MYHPRWFCPLWYRWWIIFPSTIHPVWSVPITLRPALTAPFFLNQWSILSASEWWWYYCRDSKTIVIHLKKTNSLQTLAIWNPAICCLGVLTSSSLRRLPDPLIMSTIAPTLVPCAVGIQCPVFSQHLQKLLFLQVTACSNLWLLLHPPSSFPAVTSSSLRASSFCDYQHSPWKTLYWPQARIPDMNLLYTYSIHFCQNCTFLWSDDATFSISQLSTDLFSCLYFFYDFNGIWGGRRRKCVCSISYLELTAISKAERYIMITL